MIQNTITNIINCGFIIAFILVGFCICTKKPSKILNLIGISMIGIADLAILFLIKE